MRPVAVHTCRRHHEPPLGHPLPVGTGQVCRHVLGGVEARRRVVLVLLVALSAEKEVIEVVLGRVALGGRNHVVPAVAGHTIGSILVARSQYLPMGPGRERLSGFRVALGSTCASIEPRCVRETDRVHMTLDARDGGMDARYQVLAGDEQIRASVRLIAGEFERQRLRRLLVGIQPRSHHRQTLLGIEFGNMGSPVTFETSAVRLA